MSSWRTLQRTPCNSWPILFICCVWPFLNKLILKTTVWKTVTLEIAMIALKMCYHRTKISVVWDLYIISVQRAESAWFKRRLWCGSEPRAVTALSSCSVLLTERYVYQRSRALYGANACCFGTKFSHYFATLCATMQLDEALCYKPEDRGFDSRWGHLDFSLTLSFRSHYSHGVDSASNSNE